MREQKWNADDRNPRRAFMEDLSAHIRQWMQEGDQVLICGDINHDVREEQIIKMFEDLQLVNLIYAKHDVTKAPSTYFLKEEGRIVDGIWGSPGLIATKCGYLRPEVFPGNHSLLWVDISYERALGHNPRRPQVMAARRLQLHDPRCVKRYLSSYQAQIQLHNLPQRQF
jgi:hypothetical protein